MLKPTEYPVRPLPVLMFLFLLLCECNLAALLVLHDFTPLMIMETNLPFSSHHHHLEFEDILLGLNQAEMAVNDGSYREIRTIRVDFLSIFPPPQLPPPK